VTLTVERDAVGVFVTHLADDLEPLPDEARVDGIFAEGLDDELELDVDYQPRFGTVGRSTPEFIVSRLIARSDGRQDRSGYDVLARAVGVEKVQKTLDEV
jgi:DNA mismatch repair protein MutS2